MSFAMNSRKHRLADDQGIVNLVKKLRLDTLLLNLSLNSDRPIAKPVLKTPKYTINSMVDSEQQAPRQSSIDSYISEKIMQEFKDKIVHDYAVIPWVLPLAVVAFHFQRWLKRLFNSFVQRFNETHPERKPVKRFSSYFKIIRLVQDPSVAFTIEDLGNILMEYNQLEQKKVALKRDKRADSKKVEEMHEEEQLARESKYAYWDRFSNLQQDVVMEDGSYEVLDAEMEMDEPIKDEPLEANYGNYY